MEEQPSKPSFSYQILDGVSFDNQNLEGVSFANATISNASFNNTILLGADFSDDTITDSSFENAKFGHSSDLETEMSFRVFCQVFLIGFAFMGESSSEINTDYPSESKISTLFTGFLFFTGTSIFYFWKIFTQEFNISLDVIGVLVASILAAPISLLYAISLLRKEFKKPRLTRFKNTTLIRVKFGFKNSDDLNLLELSKIYCTECDLEAIS
jgi:uncharacterized protein YjbI with pentapeptide repeats